MGNHPQMAELFRLVNYYNLPSYIEDDIFYIDLPMNLLPINSPYVYRFAYPYEPCVFLNRELLRLTMDHSGDCDDP